MELNEVTSKRAACLGVVTRHVNSLRALLLKPVGEVGAEVEKIVNKLLEAKEKFDSVHDAVMVHEDVAQKTQEDYRDSATKAGAAVVSVLDDYEAWKKHDVISLSEMNQRRAPVADGGGDVQMATLVMLQKLQQSLEDLKLNSVDVAVRNALQEQQRQHEAERERMRQEIIQLQQKADRSDLVRNVAAGDIGGYDMTGQSKKLSFDFSGVEPSIIQSTSTLGDRDYRTGQPTGNPIGKIQARSSSFGPRRMAGFGRGRQYRHSGIQEDEMHRVGTSMTNGLEDTSMFMASLLEQSALHHETLVANLQAPKVTIQKFDGSPLDYVKFTSAFDELVEGTIQSDRAKLLMLSEHCEGKAQKAIAGSLHMSAEEGYKRARTSLREKFGAPHVIVQAWLDKMMAYDSLNTVADLEAYARDLECCTNSLKSMDAVAEIENTGSLRILVSKLPINLRNKWRKTYRKFRRDGGSLIDMLVDLIRDAAEDDADPAFNETVIQRVRSTYGVTSPTPKGTRVNTVQKQAQVNYIDEDWTMAYDETRADEPITTEVYSVTRSACAACRSGQHFTSRCRGFKELGPAERLEFVNKKNLCVLCLSDSHRVDNCPLPWKCQEKTCGKKHHTALHAAFQERMAPVKANVNHVGADMKEYLECHNNAMSYFTLSATSLPIIRVKVRYGENTCYANALLDTGSTVTICRQELADKLYARTTDIGRLNVNTVTSCEDIRARLFSMKIGEPSSQAILPLYNVMAVNNFPLSPDAMPTGESINKWIHLRDLNIPVPEPGTVDLLIGQNNAHLMDPGMKVKRGPQEPYAVETPLGWMIYGCVDCDVDVSDSFQEEPNVWDAAERGSCYAVGPVKGLRELMNEMGVVVEDGPEPGKTIIDEDFSDTEECREQSANVYSTMESDGVRPGHEEWSLDQGPPATEGDTESCTQTELQELCEQLKRLVMLDEVPDADSLTKEERYVLDLWEREMRMEDGHVVLPIPFKSDPPLLVNNFAAAYRALKQLGRLLLADPVMREQYAAAIQEYFDLGYAEIIEDPDAAIREFVWYLIHHGVKHPRKPNVTRVVKNGAAEYRGCSINKAAYKGPDLMNGLINVLTRFRQYQVGTTGDIKGMFNQVLVPEHQRDYGRFLFWENGDPNGKIIICRMKTHVFGSVWAPAAANFALKKMAILVTPEKPRVTDSILQDFYVDDWLNSVEDEDQASDMLLAVQSTVAKGSFELGKIASSSRRVLSNVPTHQRVKELARIDLSSDKLPRGIMLGQGWEPNIDELMFELMLEPKPFTKRGMTSCVSSLFDPLGLLSPFILPAKILMQQGCRSGQGWDELLDGLTLDQWSEWLREFPSIEKFRLNRWFGCGANTTQILHIFGDASEKSYAAASFLAVRRARGSVSTLVMSKSRIAPTKRLTIPKLEMAGAVLAVKLGKLAEKMFNVIISGVFYWVDSTIVLVLIHKDPAELKTFMGNRVAYIQSNTELEQWGHVPSELNPADIASRGMRMSDLSECEMWKRGPDFIRQEQEAWPAKTVKIKGTDAVSAELKKKMSVFSVTVEAILAVEDLVLTPQDLVELESEMQGCAQVMSITSRRVKAPDDEERKTADRIVGRYSNWEKTLRFAAYMIRYARFVVARVKGDGDKQRELVRTTEVSLDEVELAEKQLICWAQRLEISDADKKDVQWTSLLPYMDEEGLLRVGGRNMYAEMPNDVKFPVILPRTGKVTDMLIRVAHDRVGHGGTDRTLMELRSGYWVIGGRTTVKRITSPCIVCRRLKGRPEEQIMAPLPAERLESGRPVFWNCGVDLFGPMKIVVRRSSVKRYGAIFTCFCTRAIHLEPVDDLSASAFLDTLERFSCRRGLPDKMKSDNGTNFVYTSKMIPEVEVMVESREFKRELVRRRIRWTFNSPAASHQGGVWERLIRSVRELLVVLIDGRQITDSRFHTVLCMAEAIMNSRPLTRLTEEVRSVDALTPAHFIHLRAISPVFPGRYSADQLRQDWRTSQGMATEFWDRWMKLYVPSLQKRTKWLKERPNVREGELVLLVCDQYARCDWPLGIVSKVHPGGDGKVRNVTLKTQSGYMKRPIQKIVRLELDVT